MKVTKILSLLRGAKGKKASEFSDEVCRAIYEAAHSPHEDVKTEACLLVHEGLRKWEHEVVFHYGITPANPDYEDYIQECGVMIMQHLKDWNPEKGKLITFFSSWFNKACTKCRLNSSTQSSIYYEEVSVDIAKARELLLKDGIDNPSCEDICNKLKSVGIMRSIKTIRCCIEQQFDIASLDACTEVSDISDVESIVLTEVDTPKYSDKIYNCINSMDETYKLVMKIECEFYSSHYGRSRLDAKEFHQELKKYLPDVTLEWASDIRKTAHQQFRLLYKGKQKKKVDLQDLLFA